MQLETLEVMFSSREFHFPDTPRLPFREPSFAAAGADIPSDDSIKGWEYYARPLKDYDYYEYEFRQALPGGMDKFVDIFRPFCGMIRSMRIQTFVDTDCIDTIQYLEISGEPNVRDFYQGVVEEPRAEPASVLTYSRMADIFNRVRHLDIRIAAQEHDSPDRKLPRYLVQDEFLSMLRKMNRLRLDSCTVRFDRDFIPQRNASIVLYEPGGITAQKWRRECGRHTTEDFLRYLESMAENALMGVQQLSSR